MIHSACGDSLTNDNAPLDDFSKSFMYLIHQMHFLIQKHLDQLLLKHKSLTFSQFMIMVGLTCSHNGPVSQSTIAAQLDLTEATVSRHIATLVKLGLVKREEDSMNRRKHILSVTKKGSDAFQKARLLIDTELDSLFSVIPAKDRVSITKNFKLVLKNLLTKK
jgi:DNA-binding MarR family transcriptional regulator